MPNRSQTLSNLYFSFEGRINRAKYWIYGIVIAIVFCAIIGLFYLAVGVKGLPVGYVIAIVAAIWPGLALAIKRCHDRGRSGYFIIVGFIPIACIWYLAEIGFMRGTFGENQYGPDPLAAKNQG
jgi:uncharacterized membrane protein YhaH (DUF805 family)